MYVIGTLFSTFQSPPTMMEFLDFLLMTSITHMYVNITMKGIIKHIFWVHLNNHVKLLRNINLDVNEH